MFSVDCLLYLCFVSFLFLFDPRRGDGPRGDNSTFLFLQIRRGTPSGYGDLLLLVFFSARDSRQTERICRATHSINISLGIVTRAILHRPCLGVLCVEDSVLWHYIYKRLCFVCRPIYNLHLIDLCQPLCGGNGGYSQIRFVTNICWISPCLLFALLMSLRLALPIFIYHVY